ncbi:MAG: response regulator [Candidatus Omnitrophota bacterium]
MARKILVIEDELSVRRLVEFIFSKNGFEVVGAGNGQEGLDLARQHNPDLIILDLRLPIMDGVAVGKELKGDEKLRKIPVILVTASTDNIEEKVRESLVDSYFLKPFDYQELLKKVEELLRREL